MTATLDVHVIRSKDSKVTGNGKDEMKQDLHVNRTGHEGYRFNKPHDVLKLEVWYIMVKTSQTVYATPKTMMPSCVMDPRPVILSLPSIER